MVILHVKKTEQDQFLFETTVAKSNDEVIREVVGIWNKRHQMQRLAAAVLELAKHGPAKPEDMRGLDDDAPGVDASKLPEKGPHYNKDPTAQRTGSAPSPELAETLRKTAEDALAVVSKDQVARRRNLSLDLLQERVDNIRGAVTMAFPMGLPDYDIIRIILEGHEEVAGTGAAAEHLDPATAEMWWAGKDFPRDQRLADRVGRNEKTKIIVKLQKKGGGPPSREPAVSEEERKAMMAHYFKKQEEAKRAAEDDEDAFLNARWADPKALKSSLLGTGGISFRPGGR